jgi:hypothetical protein
MRNESNYFSDEDIVTNILNGNIQGFAIVVRNTEKLVTQIVRKMTTTELAHANNNNHKNLQDT